jgi:hypothetical protein
MQIGAWIGALSLAALAIACSGAHEDVAADEAHLEAPAAPGASNIPLFQSQDILSMRLEAPLQDLFDQIPKPVADEYAPGGFQVPDVSSLSTKGKLVYTDAKGAHRVPVTITLRGNTSLFELPFPKLTLDVAKPDAKGTIFEHSKKLKLGTHGGETDRLTPLGRRINQESTHREAFVYALLDSLGIPTLKTRPALMTYLDTGTKKVAQASPAGELVRKAFFLEDDDDAAQRYGATVLDEAADGGLDAIGDEFDWVDVERIGLAEALVGNVDWQLDRALWNVKAFKQANGHVIFAPYDFDLAATVTAFEPEAPPLFFPKESVEVRNEAVLLNTLRANGFEKKTLEAALASLVAKRGAAEAAIAASSLAAADKAIMKKHLDAFYAAAAPEKFYLPGTTGPAPVFTDATLKTRLLADGADPEDIDTAYLRCGSPLEVIELSADKKAAHVRFLFQPFAGKDEGWMEAESVYGADGKFPDELNRCFVPGMD